MKPGVAAHYLNVTMEESPEHFLEALKQVAQARQMSQVAKGCGGAAGDAVPVAFGAREPDVEYADVGAWGFGDEDFDCGGWGRVLAGVLKDVPRLYRAVGWRFASSARTHIG
jgi:hypothetical protein